MTAHAEAEPSRAEIDALAGSAVVEFGAQWCNHCLTAQPLIADALTSHPNVRHLKIEDGPGLPLGRSFGVKLWPTLVFLHDGRELARLVRPQRLDQVRQALLQIDAAAA